MSVSLPVLSEPIPEDITHALEKGHLIQAAIAAILRLSLEPITLDEQLQRILELIVGLDWLPFLHQGCIFLCENGNQRLVMKAQVGMPAPTLATCDHVAFGTCICGRAIAQKQFLFKNCIDDHHCIRYIGMVPHGHYCVPLVVGGRDVGLLNLYVREGHDPSPEEGQFLHAVANVLAGIIERQRAEAELRRCRAQLDLLVLGTSAGTWDWDLSTNCVAYSPRWKAMLGYAVEEIGIGLAEWEGRLWPEDRPAVLESLRSSLIGRLPEFRFEYRLLHRDGSYRQFLAYGQVIRDGMGRSRRVIVVDLDVTERKHVEEELRRRLASLTAARRIVEHLLPRAALRTRGLEVEGASVPADFALGDLFDFFPLADGSVLAVIADVSGHGIASALLMASVSARVRSFAEAGIDIDEISSRTNSALASQTDGQYFVTMLLVHIDSRSRSLRFISAGHPPGFILDRTGELVASLESTALPLIVQADATFPVLGSRPLEPGDLVVLYTDGVFEANSPEGTPFGTEHLLRSIRKRIEAPLDEILRGLHADVREFTGPSGPEDDVTALLLRVV